MRPTFLLKRLFVCVCVCVGGGGGQLQFGENLPKFFKSFFLIFYLITTIKLEPTLDNGKS